MTKTIDGNYGKCKASKPGDNQEDVAYEQQRSRVAYAPTAAHEDTQEAELREKLANIFTRSTSDVAKLYVNQSLALIHQSQLELLERLKMNGALIHDCGRRVDRIVHHSTIDAELAALKRRQEKKL